MSSSLATITPEEIASTAKTEAARYFREHRVLNLVHDDVMSDAMYGALVASTRYQSDRGASFHTFAAQRVKGAIIDGMRTRGGRIGTLAHEARNGFPISLDAPLSNDEDDTVASTVIIETGVFEDAAVNRVDVRIALKRLTPREQKVVYAYFFQDLMLKEIAEDMGISEGRVCQILTRGKAKLRHLLTP